MATVHTAWSEIVNQFSNHLQLAEVFSVRGTEKDVYDCHKLNCLVARDTSVGLLLFEKSTENQTPILNFDVLLRLGVC